MSEGQAGALTDGVSYEMAKAGGDALYDLCRDMDILSEPPFGRFTAREVARDVFTAMLAAGPRNPVSTSTER
jgi:hypothetical protein